MGLWSVLAIAVPAAVTVLRGVLAVRRDTVRRQSIERILPDVGPSARCPVTAGHLLVIPHVHVPDATTQPAVSAHVMACGAALAGGLPVST